MATDDTTRSAASLFAPRLTCNWPQAGLPTIYPPDIYQPWRSVFGFAVTAGQLAASQLMALHCREDEVFKVMAALNALLANPASLQRAFVLLQKLRNERLEKLSGLVEFQRAHPVTRQRVMRLGQASPAAARPADEQKVKVEMERLLSPRNAALEVAGLTKMLVRLEKMLSALEQVQPRGFRVIVRDRRRTPAHPALEARRTETAPSLGGNLPAGFLLPTQYHLTLWTYLVERNACGQSAVWN